MNKGMVQGSAFRIPFPDKTFHAILTSPPYFGLRSYHGEQVTDWGGDFTYVPMPFLSMPEIYANGAPCALGAEENVEDYVGHLLLVARELWRVLRDDGVFWLNIGDSYNGSGGAGGDYNEGGSKEGQPRYPGRSLGWLQPGDLIGVPWRVAFALQADGWILRGAPVWVKDSVMPEGGVNGWRFGKAPCHCMTERREASIREQMAEQGVERHRVYKKAGDIPPDPACPDCLGSGRVGEERLRQASWRHTRAYEMVFQFVKSMGYFGDRGRAKAVSEGDGNPRDILRPGRDNYSGQHFAVYPPALVAPLIAATVPRMCCIACGQGWAPSEHDGVYRSTCDCGRPEAVPGLVLDPFFGSGSTAVAAMEIGVRWAGLDISRQYLAQEAGPRLYGWTPADRLKDLPLFGGLNKKE